MLPSCQSMGWACCGTAQGDTKPQTATAADSWGSHWDTGQPWGQSWGTAGSQHPPPACRAAAMTGPTLHGLVSSCPCSTGWSLLSCSSPIPPGCRISPGTHQTTAPKAGSGMMGPSTWWAHLLWLALPKCGVATTCPCNTRVQLLASPASSHQEYQ